MKNLFKTAALAFAALLAFGTAACNGDDGGTDFVPFDESLRIEDARGLSSMEYTLVNLSATDDFARTVDPVDQKTDSDRYVGLFYFLWLGVHNHSTSVFDVSEITQNGAHNEYFFDIADVNSPENVYHFWGKPVWGYYHSTDEWVIRKQVEMFTLAGVDFLVFDCTNNLSYPETTSVLLKVLKEYHDAGWSVPKVMYYLAYDDGKNSYPDLLKKVYKECYESGEYRSLWFAPDGKPLITMPQRYYNQGRAANYGLDVSDETMQTILDMFEFKCRQWPNEPYESNGVPWMEWGEQYSHNGWMNVSVAQHISGKMSDGVRYGVGGAHGRAYTGALGLPDDSRAAEDLNYIRQWQTVLDQPDPLSARFTFLTGWNEWIALKQKDGKDKYCMVDTFNPAYSRDLEPSENLGDNGYLLTAQKIRENNFGKARHYIYPSLTMDIGRDDEKWADVPAYLDFTNDCLDRDSVGYVQGDRMTDSSGRNDISSVQVAHDDDYLYFRVETKEPLTGYEAGDTGYMNVWIKVGGGSGRYYGYDYVIGKSYNGGSVRIDRATGSGLKQCGSGDVRTDGRLLFLRIPRSALKLSGANYDIEFKVTDNVREEGNYLDFYRTGDAAPIGRLNYRYGY